MIDFFKGPIYMGVVNVTPDSFSDGGKFLHVEEAISHALQLERDGAHILDIGGESTRPNAETVSVEEECARVIPVIKGLREAGVQALISLDTRNAETMERAILAGIDMINDVSALTHDPRSFDVAIESALPICLMHMQGNPETMQIAPVYENAVDEVFQYLARRVQVCLDAGANQKNVICDPGIGFGKALEDNLNILKNINKFHELECPLLLGVSRKSFIEKICPNTPVDQRLAGSIAANLWGLSQGIQLFRVHDVAETKQAFDVSNAISQ